MKSKTNQALNGFKSTNGGKVFKRTPPVVAIYPLFDAVAGINTGIEGLHCVLLHNVRLLLTSN